jgi:metal-responsive CopG/Arc/MetJ family transcriptional regulator
MKQISLTIPEKLYDESKRYCSLEGYRNVQELILEMLRDEIFKKNLPKYERILKQAQKTGKRMTQEEARKFIRDF